MRLCNLIIYEYESNSKIPHTLLLTNTVELRFEMNLAIEFTLLEVIIVLSSISLFHFLLFIKKINLDNIVLANVLLMFIAFIEPAPSDLLFIILLIIFIKEKTFSKVKYYKIWPVTLFLLLYLFIAALSLLNVNSLYIGLRYFGISCYLIIYSLIIFFYCNRKNCIPILRIYVISCTVAAIVGIIGYLGFFSEILRLDAYRTKSLFKDPNVFGAYIVPAVILLVGDLQTQKLFTFKRKESKNRKTFKYFNENVLFNIFLVIINTTGIIIAFSRGAWLSLAVGTFTLFLLNLKKINIGKINYKGFLIYFGALISMILFVWFGIFSGETRTFFIQRISLRDYDADRFRVQAIGVRSALDHVFGYGTGQFEGTILQKTGEEYSAHSLYVRVLFENGLIGFLLIIATFIFIIVKSLQVRKLEKSNMLSSVFISIMVSLFVNSIVIDTLHWRNFWLFIGLSLSYISEFQVVKLTERGLLEKAKIIIWIIGRKLKSIIYCILRNILAFIGMFHCIFKGHDNEILILMYHRVNDDINMELSVKINKFKWQMNYLMRKNYKVISMEEAFQMIKKKSIYGKYIVLTFDDGYKDIFDNALPILKQLNYPSIHYIVPGYIESNRVFPWDKELGESRLMNWKQVKELNEDKLFEIGSHTLNHYDLDKLDEKTLRIELEESKNILYEKMLKEIKHFAYPRGIYSEESEKILCELYNTGVLIFRGAKVDNQISEKEYYRLKRIPVYRSDGKFMFIARIKGGVWLEEIVRDKFARFLSK